MTFTSKFDIPERAAQHLAQVDARYSVTVHIVRIAGQRWEYMMGSTNSDEPMQVLHRIELEHGYGAVVYGGEPLTDPVVQALRDDIIGQVITELE